MAPAYYLHDNEARKTMEKEEKVSYKELGKRIGKESWRNMGENQLEKRHWVREPFINMGKKREKVKIFRHNSFVVFILVLVCI